jgi:hypothetical protein
VPDVQDALEVAPPYALDVGVSLAAGVTPPSHGKVALVVAMPLPYAQDPKQELHLFEYGTTDLPAQLPARVPLPLGTPPSEVLDVARAWASDPGPLGPNGVPVVVNARVVVYDDANANGRMDIDPDAVLGGPSHASGSASAGGWAASEFVLWYGAFAATNEMISLDSISARYADASSDYTLTRESGRCDSLPGGSTCCASEIGPLSGDLVIGWPN